MVIEKPKKSNISTKRTVRKINGYAVDIPQTVRVEKSVKKEPKKSWLYYELEEAFNDVRLMREGKKPKKTAQEFLEEIRKSK